MNEAMKYAQTQSDTFKNSLQYLIDQQNTQKMQDKSAATTRYDNLIEQINQQTQPIQSQYEDDSQQAYINKMLGGKEIESNLSQMGLNTQGFGVTQQALNEAAYGANTTALKTDKNAALLSLANDATNATGEYNANMLETDADYSGKLSDLMQAIEAQAATKYDSSYANYIENQQYQDALKQQAKDNELNWYNAKTSRTSANASATAARNPFVNSGDDEDNNEEKIVNKQDSVPLTKMGSPKLSTEKGRIWYYLKINSRFDHGKEVTGALLKSELTNAFNSGTINQNDVATILKQFGLE